LIYRESGGYRVFSPAYERWIVDELTQCTGRGDYATWLEQNEPYYGGKLKPLYSYAEQVTSLVDSRYWNLLTEWLSKSDNIAEIMALLKKAAEPDKKRPVWLAFAGE
jgi:hypothetical protein